MRKELSPLAHDKKGRYYDVGHSLGVFYFYSVCEWANGAHGSIVDLLEIKDEINEKGEPLYDNPIAGDWLFFVCSDIDLEHGFTEEEEKRCPMIACGIVAYWLKQYADGNRNNFKIFEDYYNKQCHSYIYLQQCRRMDTWNVNLEEEFANGAHLRSEQQSIEKSCNLLPFLQESDRQRILNLTEHYLKYVESKATKKTKPKREKSTEETISTTPLPLEGIEEQGASSKPPKDYSRRSFILNVNKKGLEDLFSKLSEKDEKTGKSFIDGNIMKHNDAQNALGIERKDEFEKLIKDTDPKDIDKALLGINKALFNLVFSGQETDVRIVWRANANDLLYLIDTMHRTQVVVDGKIKKLLDFEPGPGIWELTRSRFMNGKPRKVEDKRTGKMMPVDEPVEFKEDAFNHQNYPQNTTQLDNIIDKIAPHRFKDIQKEIQDDFNNKENFRRENKNSLGELRGEGHFRDTIHKPNE